MKTLISTEPNEKSTKFRFNHETVKKMDQFIQDMPINKWFSIGDDETKLAVIKDWIDKDLLRPYYLTLSTDYKSFIKRKI